MNTLEYGIYLDNLQHQYPSPPRQPEGGKVAQEVAAILVPIFTLMALAIPYWPTIEKGLQLFSWGR